MAEDNPILDQILNAVKWLSTQVTEMNGRVQKLEESKQQDEDDKLDPALESKVWGKLIDKVMYMVTEDVSKDYGVQQTTEFSLRAKRTIPNEQTIFETWDEANAWLQKNIPEPRRKDCFITTKTVTYEQ